MNQVLWNKIAAFDFDNTPSEYGFSTRLANENYWTKNFTEQAIMEYKKFMYLAATSEFMVSPSEIIDTVWHQHLIFTQSYQDFCKLIGRQVQHIPSTHNKEEFEKFRQAKERTGKLYQEIFGEQPKSIWGFNSMYESLNLDKARFKIRTFLVIAILTFLLMTIPFYFLLRPVYVQIENPYFMIGYIALIIIAFIFLDTTNGIRLKQIIKQFDSDSFIYHLQPYELVYLKTQKLSDVINGVLNELLDKGTIRINDDRTIETVKNEDSKTIENLQTVNSLNIFGKASYPNLLRDLASKPVFWNTANCMDAFKKYFNKSKKFGNLFYLNFGLLSILLLIGFTRLVTGILRDKPVTIIAFTLLVLIVSIIFYLLRLSNLVSTSVIPNLYKNEILPQRQIEGDWQWSYFLFGTAVLTTSFVPLINYGRASHNSDASYSSSCGSSCGSSCSSCGGCGGGD